MTTKVRMVNYPGGILWLIAGGIFYPLHHIFSYILLALACVTLSMDAFDSIMQIRLDRAKAKKQKELQERAEKLEQQESPTSDVIGG